MKPTKKQISALFDACVRAEGYESFFDLCSLYDKMTGRKGTAEYISSGDYLKK